MGMKGINFKQIEKKWQKEWAEKKAFEAETDKKKKKFFFTTPYPYISGSLHIGQGRAITESDIYCRFMRMNGFNVLFPMAFHISGMPVLGIAAAIKNKDNEKIKLYEEYVSAYVKDKKKVKDIVKSFENPKKIVEFFIPRMKEEYSGLGVGVDWRRSFTSGDIEHQNLVKWQFSQYKDKGYLIQGMHPVLYSVEDESAVGEDDIIEGDSIPVEKQEFTLIKFKLGKKFLVAASLRPETIFGVTNIWVNPDVEYVEAKVGDEVWIMSKEGFDKLKYQRKDIVFLGKTKEKLIGDRVRVPIIEKEVLVLPSKIVDSDIASGIVMSVPSSAPYDYTALKILQQNKELIRDYGFSLKEREDIEDIEIIPIIQTSKFGDKAAVAVVEKHGIELFDDVKLESLTQEVYKEEFHNGFMLDTCGRYKGLSVREAKEKVKWELLGNKNASLMFETSRKALSRSGGKIIVAFIDGQWFLDFNSKGWKEKARECLRQVKLEPENMRRLFEDTFEWLDKRPCARKRGLGTEFPFDKGWVVESLSDSTMYMCLYPIVNLIRENKINKKQLNREFFDFVFLGKGKIEDVAEKTNIKENVLKEIKESFDYWMPLDHRHTFVLHLSNHLSFMIFAFAGLLDKEYWPKKISFHGLVISSGEKMSKSRGNVITLLDAMNRYGADVFRFYLTSSTSVDGIFDWKDKEVVRIKESVNKLYEIIEEAINKRKVSDGRVSALYVSRFNSIIKKATENIREMKLREYNMAAVYDMLRLIKDARLALDDKELRAFYNLIAEDWIKMIAPVTPHIAEELWSKVGKGLVSLQDWPKYDEKKINEKLEEAERLIDNTISDIINVINLVKKQGKPVEMVYLYVLPKEIGNYNERVLSVRVSKSVKVYAVNDIKKYDPAGKSGKAKPGKPGIYVE